MTAQDPEAEPAAPDVPERAKPAKTARRHVEADGTRTKPRELDGELSGAAAELEDVLALDVTESVHLTFGDRPAAPDDLLDS